MAKKKNSNKNLMLRTEKYAIKLLSEAMGGKVKPSDSDDGMEFSDKRALLDSLTRLLAIQHRISPDQEESAFMSLREELNGSSRAAQGRTNASSGATDSGDDSDDSDFATPEPEDIF